MNLMTSKKDFNFIKRTQLILTVLLFSVFTSFSQSYNYEKATEAFKAKDYDLALDFYTREISDNPKNIEALFYRAIVYQYKEKNSLAISDVNAALKGFNKKEKKWIAACHSLKASIYIDIDQREKAIEEYTLAIKSNEEYKTYYISRAQVYYDLNKFDKAEADYLKVIKMDESDVQALAGLGRNYLALKNYTESEKIFDQVIKLNSEYNSAYYFRAILFYKQKKYNNAIADAFYAYVLDESDSDNRRLFLNYAEKNITLALSKVNSKINEFPEKEDWYFVRAQLNESTKDYFAAIADYNKMLDVSDGSYRNGILTYRADCYKNEGLYDQAIADYDEAISLDSTRPYYFSGRGDAKRLKGDYAGAVADFSISIKLDPEQSWYYYRRGWVKDEFLNDTEGGLKDYSEAISIDNNYTYAYLHRGRLYREKLKDEKKANQDFSMMLTLDTTISYSGNCRHYALFHLNRNTEAIEWLNKILEEYPNEHNYYDAACLYSLMKMPKESISNLALSFENGYRDFIHLSNDDDLDFVRNNSEFISLVNDWKKKFELTKSKNPIEVKTEEVQTYQTTTIPMKSRGSGTYEVSCKVNDLKLSFIFDTGASDISISQTEALFMLKNDYLAEADIKGKENYMDANGDISVGTKILLKKVEIGGLILKNVSASVVNNKNAPLLFGQSALSKYGKIIIDNKKSEITITVPESKGK